MLTFVFLDIVNLYQVEGTSGKHVRAMNTPVNPTFI